mmetsp:Transcript_52826/g.115247  ORF Transcript_52826/g.115247 Transcript_52826/m.115247 type:complete len:240 (-) Transcript_52826:61-780(-)
MAEGKVQPVSLAYNVKGVHFMKEGKEPTMRVTLELSIDMPVTKLVYNLDEAFGKSDETKQKESVSLISKESTQFAPPRQETSSTTRRMESEKPKSLSLSVSTATPTIPQEVSVPQPAPVQPQPAKAPKYSRQTHPDYVKSQRWNRKDKEGEKKDVFFIDMEAFRNAQFEPLPEPSRKELMHANYKEVDWRIGDVPVPRLVVDNEKENQEPEGDKVAQEHQSDHVPPSRVGAHAEKCAQQ